MMVVFGTRCSEINGVSEYMAINDENIKYCTHKCESGAKLLNQINPLKLNSSNYYTLTYHF